MSIKYVAVCYTWLYIVYVTHYLHQLIIFCLLLWKVHSRREAFVCQHNHSHDRLRPVDAFFIVFPDVFPKVGIEMADTSYRNSIISTHKHTHTHTFCLERNNKSKGNSGENKNTSVWLIKDLSVQQRIYFAVEKKRVDTIVHLAANTNAALTYVTLSWTWY